MAKQNYRCAGCGTRIDPGVVFNVMFHEQKVQVLRLKNSLFQTQATNNLVFSVGVFLYV